MSVPHPFAVVQSQHASAPPQYHPQQQPPPQQYPSQATSSSSPTEAMAGPGGMVAVEDCRDYLRTGRCKYGASCKYNHPANVQSGGGMKAPINPGEPLFPLRPTEPICQYYMKHGSCKFGQACKFHHPPLQHQQQQSQSNQPFGGVPTPPASLQAFVTTANGRVNGSTPLLMSLGGTQHILSADNGLHAAASAGSHPLLCNPIGADPTSGSMILQFLPQRPDEPDCIYFLKNGRCKYGATCRYHHPIAYPSSSSRRGPPQGHNSQRAAPAVSYVSHVFPSSAYASAQHSLTGDNNSNHGASSASPSFQPIPVVAVDGTSTFAFPLPEAHHHSSASSLASSYDTAGSNLEQQQLHGDAATALVWNRARRNGSGGSLAAYGDQYPPSGSARGGAGPPPKQPGGGGILHGSASDGNIAARDSRRHRSTSYGSTSDASSSFSYYDATAASTISRTPSVGSWRVNSDGTLESSARGGGGGGGRNIPASSSSYSGRPEVVAVSSSSQHDFAEASTPPSAGSGRVVIASGSSRSNQMMAMPAMPPVSGGGAAVRYRRSPRGSVTGRRENDEGFTMMTSALLNMLDAAPEELAGVASYDEDDNVGDARLYYDAATATQQSSSKSTPRYSPSSRPHPIDDPLDPAFFERLSFHRGEESSNPASLPSDYYSRGTGNSHPHAWSPTLRPGNSDATMGRSLDQEGSLHHLLANQQQHQQQHQPYQDHHAASAASTGSSGPNSYGGGDVGLYLP